MMQSKYMLATQCLVKKAKHESVEVCKEITWVGLQCHLYSCEPRQKRVEAIWHLVFTPNSLSFPILELVSDTFD